MSKTVGVYKISCSVNSKIYIGSSINIYKRWFNHRYELNNNKHHANYLQHAWNKYGKDCFIFEILEKIEDVSVLIEREQYWMDYYQSYKPAYGFNSNSKAEGNHKRKWTKQQREKYSKSRKGKPASEALQNALNNSRKIGSKSNLSSIDENKVIQIVNDINSGLTPNEVSKLHSVGISIVRSICQKRNWKHILQNLTIREIGTKSQRQRCAKLNEEQVRNIKKRLAEGENHLTIAEEYNVSRTTILDIKKNKTWKDITI